jgi:metallophosphoesterase (TIGR00282 family)
VRILFIGDIVGKPGRKAVSLLLPRLRKLHSPDLVIANAENIASGRGLTPSTVRELFISGVDVLTSGNHAFDNREILPQLETESPILRPYNYPPGTPGRGVLRVGPVTIINLIGRVFMQAYDDPFRAIDSILEDLDPSRPIFVDFHAEATSEKQAFGWYVDGRVSAVVGTHTHVPTADQRVLPKGTAYVTDAGMTGARESVIGDDVDVVLQRFLTMLPNRLVVAEHSPTLVVGAVLVDLDETTARAKSIIRVDQEIDAHAEQS